jgi:mono/diheme cytochrome c family protein
LELGVALSLSAVTQLVSSSALADAPNTDPLSEWAVADGYSLSVSARGFDLPTDVVAVPTPGSAPSAPRFFVTQLRGHIKIIANDGSLREWGAVPTFTPHLEWPDYSGEAGLGGLCLEPEQGLVFVTYAYRDPSGVLRNGVSRFKAQPGTFEGAPSAPENYSALLANAHSAFSHQIGSCVVKGGAVYIAVGDGGNPAAARDTKLPVGKILRLTLDGKPHPDNVFAAAGGAEALVFAYGVRNPFGLAMLDNQLYAAENGVEIDRFIAIRAGRDHGWDGTDASIATNALAVFKPTIGPAHLAYVPPTSKALPPSQLDRFLIAASNSQQGPGLVLAELDSKAGMLTGAPQYIARYEGGGVGQAVTGVVALDDAVYFSPILPLGQSAVLLKLNFDPAHAHKNVIGKKAGDPMVTRGCFGCHSLNGLGGHVGPPLDQNSVLTRTETKVLDPSYAAQMEKLDMMGDEAIVAGMKGRHEVVEAPRDKKVRAWVINRIMNPKFDMPDASMPTLGIGREEAERIADHLLGAEEQSKTREALTSKRFLGGVALGLFAGAGGVAALMWLGARRRRGTRGVVSA